MHIHEAKAEASPLIFRGSPRSTEGSPYYAKFNRTLSLRAIISFPHNNTCKLRLMRNSIDNPIHGNSSLQGGRGRWHERIIRWRISIIFLGIIVAEYNALFVEPQPKYLPHIYSAIRRGLNAIILVSKSVFIWVGTELLILSTNVYCGTYSNK